jgi:hypothetical protein
VTSGDCLNCGTPLSGRFCGECGQRAVGAYPTVREIAGDVWHELSGYDGRFVRTFRVLLAQPGELTVDTLKGRRVRYISPVRLYLVASLVYFLCAVSIPNVRLPPPARMPGSDVTISIDGSGHSVLSDEERAQALKDMERAPWWAQALLRPILVDPAGFRARFLETLPRVLFALVPVFAAIVALFYRRRHFPQHLIFAIHLHTVIFLVLAVRELSQLTRSLIVLGTFEVAAIIAIAGYALLAFRRVYGETWPRVVLKAVGIAVIYCAAGIAALLATMVWAAARAAS